MGAPRTRGRLYTASAHTIALQLEYDGEVYDAVVTKYIGESVYHGRLVNTEDIVGFASEDFYKIPEAMADIIHDFYHSDGAVWRDIPEQQGGT